MNPPPLGRLDLCFKVEDVGRSFRFYERLGFRKVEGNLEEGWCVISHRGFRVGLYKGYIDQPLLNFRGADVNAVNEFAQNCGLEIRTPYRPAEGGGGSMTLSDPDGRMVFFDTHHTELAIPQRMTEYLNSELSGELGIGEAIVVLGATDPERTQQFYLTLGFVPMDDLLMNGNAMIRVQKGEGISVEFVGGNMDQTTMYDPDGNQLDFH